ncbi:meiotically up-regulated 71 protein [Magnaporthiopsis poae ATCC 64411]|uniref:Diphthine--ammonia ligase n=1 Tax=Magnaporthiopsis poae (strain ATCC 64411 / 73-15) TaxID=644358 RepID=A0A0C4E2L3_MAGP6|nr:meiotically up-regulated 71 protein [Magnaporthiopsis poae ATCC 64411]
MAPLNVIALVSGGKDSFFSLLHCLAHQHRIVALANLHPAAPRPSSNSNSSYAGDGDEADLNSFMYQTVGHQVIPLYAEATGLPLFRHAIVGGALQQARDYDGSTAKAPVRAAQHEAGAGAGGDDDETESMVPLLKAVMEAHPEANAVCAGAILSTYQRTRVESVAVRLGLVPLAFLWKYPILPSRPPLSGYEDDDGARLLRDMAAAGLEARVVKVASGGLDESFLWENVASQRGVARLTRAMAMFAAESGVGGASLQPDGAVLGEGGEFETIVVNGPRCLFKKRIVVDEDARRLVREGGGAAWLSIDGARLEEQEQEQDAGGEDGAAWEPSALAKSIGLLDGDFAAILGAPLALDKADDLDGQSTTHEEPSSSWRYGCGYDGSLTPVDSRLEQWSVLAVHQALDVLSIRDETQDIVDQIRARLRERSLAPSNIVSAVVVLRRMSDFPTINSAYGSLFTAPNPPSRVTISCGDQLLPIGHNVSVSLTVHSASRFPVDGGRDGLHVQSRSYWAPANIGPYSQAITLPLDGIFPQQAATAAASDDENDEGVPRLSRFPTSPFSRLVFIAGQIPLVPTSMELPRCEASGTELGMFTMQAVLSLQHLWRIGVEMNVQWWSSAVVYIPRTSDSGTSSMTPRAKSMMASAAWTSMHQLPGNDGRDSEDDEGDEDGGGPDIWDRKYNPAFRGYSDGKNKKQGRRLPDWGVVDKPDGGDAKQQLPRPQGRERQVPPFFLAEVEELPRGSGAEWHAHLGFSGLAAASVATHSWSSADAEKRQGGGQDQPSNPWATQQTLVAGLSGGSGVFAHTMVAIGAPGSASLGDDKMSAEALSSILEAALQRRAPSTSGQHGTTARGRYPYLVYLDGNLVCAPTGDGNGSVIPCLSLWNRRGERLAVVALYRETWTAEAPVGR